MIYDEIENGIVLDADPRKFLSPCPILSRMVNSLALIDCMIMQRTGAASEVRIFLCGFAYAHYNDAAEAKGRFIEGQEKNKKSRKYS